MMNTADNQPFLALVDEDAHSARMMSRMLAAHGAPDVQSWGDGEAAERAFQITFDGPRSSRPSMIIVDLKSRSNATRDFLAAVRERSRAASIILVAVVPGSDPALRDSLMDAGAMAVFERHADLAAYRAEAASIVSFWVRNQRLSAVGT
jgi:AmiR/NasT family two-component response regulator